MKHIKLIIFCIFCISCSRKTISIQTETHSQNLLKQEIEEKIDNLTLLKDDSSMGMRGLYFLYEGSEFSRNDADELIKKIRKKYSFTCNITVIDNINILDKVDDINLKGSEYCFVADHFICMSTFDCPTDSLYYPFQDFLYKEYKESKISDQKEEQFWIHVASYYNIKTAESSRLVLRDYGISSSVFPYQDNKDKTFYRVLAGPFATESEAKNWSIAISTISSFAHVDTNNIITQNSMIK